MKLRMIREWKRTDSRYKGHCEDVAVAPFVLDTIWFGSQQFEECLNEPSQKNTQAD
jgi:hypothetical protein